MYDLSKMSADNVDIEKVPEGWIFSHFCEKYGQKINKPFDGRNIRARSFWTRDRTPSLFFFVNNKGKYAFKCFSSEYGGDALEFVRRLESTKYTTDVLITYNEAKQIILSEWEEYVKGNHVYHIPVTLRRYIEGKPKGEYVVEKGSWTKKRMAKWTEYKIKEQHVIEYGVVPLDWYKVIDSTGHSRKYEPEFCYGFFNRHGLWQIYIPEGNPKYITLNQDYYPGQEQMTGDPQILGILSGLKDILAFKSFELDVDLIAPRSESTLIDERTMCSLIDKYPKQFTLGDYDTVGIRMGKLYEEIYAIPPVVIPFAKDLALANKQNDHSYMKDMMVMTINRKINNNVNAAILV